MFLKNEFVDWFGEDFYKLNIVIIYNFVYNVGIMVEEGVGYVIIFDKIVNIFIISNFCFRLLQLRFELGLNIVWKKYYVFLVVMVVFLKELQEEFLYI